MPMPMPMLMPYRVRFKPVQPGHLRLQLGNQASLRFFLLHIVAKQAACLAVCRLLHCGPLVAIISQLGLLVPRLRRKH